MIYTQRAIGLRWLSLFLFEYNRHEEFGPVEVRRGRADWGVAEKMRGAEFISTFVEISSCAQSVKGLYVVFPEGAHRDNQAELPCSDFSFLERFAAEAGMPLHRFQNLFGCWFTPFAAKSAAKLKRPDAVSLDVVVKSVRGIGLDEEFHAGILPYRAEVPFGGHSRELFFHTVIQQNVFTAMRDCKVHFWGIGELIGPVENVDCLVRQALLGEEIRNVACLEAIREVNFAYHDVRR